MRFYFDRHPSTLRRLGFLTAGAMVLVLTSATSGAPQPAEPETEVEAAAEVEIDPDHVVDLTGIEYVPSALGCVALTFDDGPHWQLTEELLPVLDEEDAVATFFVLGDLVHSRPHLLRMIADAGHEIGNHSWSHANFSLLTETQIEREIEATDNAILDATGQLPRVFRFPYGAATPPIAEMIHRPVLLWDVDPLGDQHSDSPSDIASFITREVRSGSIILLHEIFPDDVEATRAIIRNIAERGFQFVTVSRLLTGQPCASPVLERHVAKQRESILPTTADILAVAAEKGGYELAANDLDPPTP